MAAAPITFIVDPELNPAPTAIGCADANGTVQNVTKLLGKAGEYKTSDPDEIAMLDSLFAVIRKPNTKPAAAPKQAADQTEE